MDIGVYLCQHTLITQVSNLSNAKRYYRLQDLLDSSHQFKIAIFDPVDYPTEQERYNDLIQTALNYCDRVILFVTEMHEETVQLLTTLNNPKLIRISAGIINDCHSYHWFKWIYHSSIVYQQHPHILEQLTPYTPKPYVFDVLLGNEKPHRSLINNYIIDNGYHNQVIMSYFKDPENIKNNFNWIMEPGVQWIENSTFYGVATNVRYHGELILLAQVVPLSIYNQTAYSIVTETFYDCNYSLFTEKIVKPILSERLFLVYAPQYYLRNLRSIGFKTFDGIIDESYDLEPDLIKRGNMITSQMKFLFEQPQQQILDKIQSITKHNKQLILSTDWNREIKTILQSLHIQ